MADWVIWGLDRAANRVTGTQVTASENAIYAGRLVDLNQATVWTPGTSAANITIEFDLGAAYNIGAVGIGAHQLTAILVEVYSGTTGIGHQGNLEGYIDAPTSNKDFVLEFTPVNTRYITVKFVDALAANTEIGTVSVLDSDYKYTMSYAPRYPIGREYAPGYAQATAGGGSPYRQVLGGTSVGMTFLFDYLAAAPGEVGDDIADGLIEQSGWMDGVWVTDDTFGGVTAGYGRGYYGTSNGPVSIPISYPGARSQMRLDFIELPKGL